MVSEHHQAIKNWQEGSNDAFDTAKKLFSSKKYHHALFFCHLAVEKALKATYINQHNEAPPYTHELARLTALINHSLTEEQVEQLDTINTYNIAARYQEDKQDLFNRATPEYASEWLAHTQTIINSLIPHD